MEVLKLELGVEVIMRGFKFDETICILSRDMGIFPFN